MSEWSGWTGQALERWAGVWRLSGSCRTIGSMEKSITPTTKKPRVLAKREFAPGVELTQMQRDFVVQLVRSGSTPTAAARAAGFSDPAVAAYDLARLPHVAAAIRFERERYISGDLANVATGTLREVMQDKGAAPAARVQAARTVLEMAGHLGKGKTPGDDEKPLAEMTLEEVTRLLGSLEHQRAQAATPLDPADVEVVDATKSAAGGPLSAA